MYVQNLKQGIRSFMKISEEELEKMILDAYKKEKGIMCGCEEISYDEYRKYKRAEILKKLEKC